MIVDTLMTTDLTTLAATMPGSGSTMQAPPGMASVMDTIIGAAKWIALAVAMIGALAAAGGAAMSRRNGSSEDATGDFVRIALSVSVIAGAVGLVSWIFEAGATG